MERALHLMKDIILSLGEGEVIDLGGEQEVLLRLLVGQFRELHDRTVDKFTAPGPDIPEQEYKRPGGDAPFKHRIKR
ncbi:MAG: hypothetical protein A4E38_00828 [Methanoregulaceae archaeon PtaB.Bin108]|nr:MAG: hypothetical protein A4E38_00828 [Methanoregulaceae archaeon PtaB.Bin108]